MTNAPATSIGRILHVFTIVCVLLGLLPLPAAASPPQTDLRPLGPSQTTTRVGRQEFAEEDSASLRFLDVHETPSTGWETTGHLLVSAKYIPVPSNPALDPSRSDSKSSPVLPATKSSAVQAGRDTKGDTTSGIASNLAITTEVFVPIVQLNAGDVEADFRATPLSGTCPLTVTFSNVSRGDITDYFWSFGDGASSTAISPTHTYTATGACTVALTATGPSWSHTLTRTNCIDVLPLPPTAGFFGAPLSGTVSLPVVFTNTTTGEVSNYHWSFGDGQSSTLVNPTHVYSTAGSFTVGLNAVGPGGSDTLTRTGYINVMSSYPVAGFYGDPRSGDIPLTVTFTNATTGEVSDYLWDFGDGHASTALDPTNVYTSTGNYTVSLTANGPGGSDTLSRASYITTTFPPPETAFSASPLTGTIPLTVTFANSTVGQVYDYLWDFGDGQTSTLLDPTHVYTTTGTFTVSLSANGPGGSDTLARSNYITTTFPPPETAFSASPVSGTIPLTVTFTNASTGEVTDYLWDFGDGQSSILVHPTHVYTTTGAYTVSLTADGPGGSDTLTRADYITTTYPAPGALFNASPLTGTIPLTVTFSNATSGQVNDYLWNFGDGQSSTLVDPTHVYTTTGTFSVSLTANGPGGSDTLLRPNYITTTFPPPETAFSASPVSGTIPLTVTFSNSTTGQVNDYLWNFGDGQTSTLVDPTHVYTSTGITPSA